MSVFFKMHFVKQLLTEEIAQRRRLPMPSYQSIQDHDLLQTRTNRLIEFVCFLIIAAFALAFCWGLFEGAADTQAIRQTELDKEIKNTRIVFFQEGK